ncbi:cytochrome b-245 heavy chain-like [Lytechinus pictus]|uniref:cytochrome b-245 heavy chain-like n=1 Tax=Lytechinus pictus TaxID=7653 RepID=UPI0030B9D5F1
MRNFGGRLVNDFVRWAVLATWAIVNLIIWLVTFFKYMDNANYVYTKYLMKNGLPVARASAACLNFNSMLILFPVCRNMISYFRGSCESKKFYRRNLRRQLDKNITFHKLLAYAIGFFVILHVVAHCFNFQNLYNGRKISSDDDWLANRLSQPSLGLNPFKTIRSSDVSGLGVIGPGLALLAGWTGAVLSVTYILMFSSATEFIRRYYFETFWLTHHLFVIYYAMLMAHGMGGVVKYQTNVDEHDPVACMVDEETFDQCVIDYPPEFAGTPGASWKWCVAPLCVYFLERILRMVRTWPDVTIVKVVQHQSKVIELRMKKQGFKMLPGQYIFLKCSPISKVQWHPFTLTSAPEEDHFSLHIRRVGDWTDELAVKMGADQSEPLPITRLPRVQVDGPFGTSCTDIFDYDVVMCVSAGIGVTPYASTLKSICYRLQAGDDSLHLKKMYFYWICRDTHAFEWFVDLLSSLEGTLRQIGKEHLLTYSIYLTRGWDYTQAKNIYMQEDREIDAVTGLRQKTHYGRPKWDSNFSYIAEQNQGATIGMFFCGPKSLSTILHQNCNKFTSDESDGTRFVYYKENF